MKAGHVRSRRAAALAVAILVMLPALGAPSSAAPPASGAACEPGVEGCLPTPEQCGTGRYNGRWEGPTPTAFAVCAGGAGHVAHYAGGDATIPCGAVIEADVLVAGSWTDPNRCFVTPGTPGSGTRGSRFEPAVTSWGGVVASESPVAAAVGRKVLASGGNAVDAAVATVFAVGVARPEMCGIGGRGYLLYRGADGTVAALDFFAAAPAAIRPGSMEGPGLDELETGHRVVGVPGVVAGMAAAARRFGSRSLASLIAPAERLARTGVHVVPELADAYGYQVYPEPVDTVVRSLPLDPIPGKPHIARLRAYPEAARIYLQAGALPYPAGATLVQSDYADSLATIMREGPRAFYRGSIARLIDAEMRRSRLNPLPGARGLLTYEDLARYRPVWRKPLAVRYRGVTVLGAPPPSASMLVMEALQILEGFDLARARHSSADHLHLFAEAQKLATADFDAYAADPAFERVPTDVLLSDRYAASRRTRIDPDGAREHGPGQVGPERPRTSAASRSGHTTHVSVVDRWGAAVSVTCSVGTGFGSAVVAPGTGFLLNSTNHFFGSPGHPNQAEPGKRPTNTQAPLIVVRGNAPILVTGASGGPALPPGVLHSVLNVVDFRMDLARAVDAARFRESECCDLFVEDRRIPAETLAELEDRGHAVFRAGEYQAGPWVQLAGAGPGGVPSAAADPRGDRGAAGA